MSTESDHHLARARELTRRAQVRRGRIIRPEVPTEATLDFAEAAALGVLALGEALRELGAQVQQVTALLQDLQPEEEDEEHPELITGPLLITQAELDRRLHEGAARITAARAAAEERKADEPHRDHH